MKSPRFISPRKEGTFISVLQRSSPDEIGRCSRGLIVSLKIEPLVARGALKFLLSFSLHFFSTLFLSVLYSHLQLICDINLYPGTRDTVKFSRDYFLLKLRPQKNNDDDFEVMCVL